MSILWDKMIVEKMNKSELLILDKFSSKPSNYKAITF